MSLVFLIGKGNGLMLYIQFGPGVIGGIYTRFGPVGETSIITPAHLYRGFRAGGHMNTSIPMALHDDDINVDGSSG